MGVLSIVLMGVAAATTHVASRAIERKDPVGLKYATQALSWIQQDSASLHFELSLLHQERGELDSAIESAARARELHDRTSYGSSLCTLYSRARRNEEAIFACRHVLDSRPRDPLAAMNLALLLTRDSERSPAELREAVELAAH